MENTVSLYVDMPAWRLPIKADDFVVTIGVRQSNSVYHVAESRVKDRGSRMIRCYLKVYKSDLITALRRGDDQQLITLTWYKR